MTREQFNARVERLEARMVELQQLSDRNDAKMVDLQERLADLARVLPPDPPRPGRGARPPVDEPHLNLVSDREAA